MYQTQGFATVCYGLGWVRLQFLLIGSFKFIFIVTVRWWYSFMDGYRKHTHICWVFICGRILCHFVRLLLSHVKLFQLVFEFSKVHHIVKVQRSFVECFVFIKGTQDVYQISGSRIFLTKHIFLQSLPLLNFAQFFSNRQKVFVMKLDGFWEQKKCGHIIKSYACYNTWYLVHFILFKALYSSFSSHLCDNMGLHIMQMQNKFGIIIKTNAFYDIWYMFYF